MYIIGSIIFIVLLVPTVTIVSIYNRFVKNRNQVKDAWSNIDVAFKRRHDLIPNLINTVKGYAIHEQDTLAKLIAARNSAIAAPKNGFDAQVKAESRLQQSLGSLFALSEAYPDLKASANFVDLQNKLDEIEENLGRSRRYYNSTVRENNTYGESFPGVLFAKVFMYRHFDFYEASEEEKQQVKVDFKN